MPTKTQKKVLRKARPSRDRALALLTSNTMRSLNAQSSVFPQMIKRTLRYVDTYSMASTAGSVATQQMRVNSLFDPDLTGTGHQPRGYDQWCSATGPYTVYRVLRSRVTVQAAIRSNQTETNEQLMSLACGYSDLSTIPSLPTSAQATVSPYGELNGWKSALIPSGGAPTVKMAFQSPINQIEGVKPSSVLTEDDYAAAYNANPANTAFFTVKANGLDGFDAVLQVQLELEFDVQFEQPILLAAS
jgi:hypothetical protein